MLTTPTSPAKASTPAPIKKVKRLRKLKTMARKPVPPIIAAPMPPMPPKKAAPSLAAKLNRTVTQPIQRPTLAATPVSVGPNHVPQPIVSPFLAAKAVEIVRVKARDEGFGKLPEHGFVRLPQILEVYPISRAGWWAGVKDGTLPAGVLLSARVRAWAVEDIRRLIAEAKQAA